MTPHQFRARAYLFLMRATYQHMVDRWWKACIRGGVIGPLGLQAMGIADPANFELGHVE